MFFGRYGFHETKVLILQKVCYGGKVASTMQLLRWYRLVIKFLNFAHGFISPGLIIF